MTYNRKKNWMTKEENGDDEEKKCSQRKAIPISHNSIVI